jgi:outer membrane protein OmpA-like peptidoglycan-associated protein
MPHAKGEATVESKRGRTGIDARFEKLEPPQKFGREYLTYILWAITPDGGPHNIGEIIPGSSNNANLEVTTDLQAFALLVTAERYSAVRQPSDVVVLENQVRSDTIGKIQQVSAKYELMPRGHYVWNKPTAADLEPANAPKVSMREYEAIAALYQAENAVGVATTANAGRYAPDTFAKAQQLLAQARQWKVNGHDSSRVVESAREAAQAAEDARSIAEKRKQAEQLANAEVENLQERQARVQAESQAERARAEAAASRAEAAAERVARQRVEAEASASQVRAAHMEAGADRVADLSPVSHFEKPGAVEKTNLRMRLLEELRGAAPTLDTPRGLVVTIAGEGFQGASLNSTASGQAMRVAAIARAHPGLSITVEGHSDNAAGEPLSWESARAVRNLLVRGGLPSNAISARGFGNSRPIVAGGRSNQRVEIVISGEQIGNVALWDRTYSLVPRQ